VGLTKPNAGSGGLAKPEAGGGGGVTDHGALTGLADDDHTQYALADGSRAFTAPVGGIAPVAGADLATKTYVDGVVVAGAIHAVLAITAVTGTTETLVGAVKLPANANTSIAAWLGEETGTYDASLRIRKASDATVLATLAASTATPAEVTAAGVNVPSEAWYELYLYSDNASGTAICTGVNFG